MSPYHQTAQADCTVEFRILDPKTQQEAWKVHEAMRINAPTVEHLIERAHLYVGRPERHENVSAIRLTGTVILVHREKDIVHDHEDTIALDLKVLRERTTPINGAAVVAG
ncbi:hypothetical protein [Evansella clarkii]|uniref:hypothetical protein n=1 Tax=Evansella clarkii TaxID=79879 RepID=UPI00099708BC|nr:hypothetical protein [Evansella clarkii]